jgi:hypothetical protein
MTLLRGADAVVRDAVLMASGYPPRGAPCHAYPRCVFVPPPRG